MNKHLSILTPAILSAALLSLSALPAQVRIRRPAPDAEAGTSQERNQAQAKKLEAQIREMRRKISDLKRQEARRSGGATPQQPSRSRGTGGGMGGMGGRATGPHGIDISQEDMRKMQQGMQRMMQGGQMDEETRKEMQELRARFGGMRMGMGRGQGSGGAIRTRSSTQERPAAQGPRRRSAQGAAPRATDAAPQTDRARRANRRAGGNDLRNQIRPMIQQFMQEMARNRGGRGFGVQGRGNRSARGNQRSARGNRRSARGNRANQGQRGQRLRALIQHFMQGMARRASQRGPARGNRRAQGNFRRNARRSGVPARGMRGQRGQRGAMMRRQGARRPGMMMRGQGARRPGMMMRGQNQRGAGMRRAQPQRRRVMLSQQQPGGIVLQGRNTRTTFGTQPERKVMTWTQAGPQAGKRTAPRVMSLGKGKAGPTRIYVLEEKDGKKSTGTWSVRKKQMPTKVQKKQTKQQKRTATKKSANQWRELEVRSVTGARRMSL